MSAAEAFAVLLTGEMVPERTVGTRLLDQMKPLFATRVLERLRSRGNKIRALQPDRLEAWYRDNFPHGFNPPVPQTRSEAVALYGDSKKRRGVGAPTILVRTLGNAVLEMADGQSVRIRSRARDVGSLGLDIARHQPRLSAPLALIENKEPFDDDDLLRRLGLGRHVIIYTQGNASKELLAWIDQSGTPEILHLPDYDATGLAGFLRLYEATGKRAKLYVPTNFAQLARDYGNPKLAIDIVSGTGRKLLKSEHPIVQDVLRILINLGTGLEQEALAI